MNSQTNIKDKNWSKYLYYLWIYTLLVILWGAWVRISHSGDGCGDHWPLCGGDYLPDFSQKKTWVEYTHRIMSGLYGLIVIYIFASFRRHSSALVKKLNLFLLLLMLSEAILGAILVKGHLVTINDSVLRLFVMSLHQFNSFMLTGVTFLFYTVISRQLNKISFYNPLLLLLFVVLPITGAIAALSTTLFPSISLWQGILQDLSSETHLFIKLRIIHPLMACIIAGGFIIWCYSKNLNRLAIEFLIAFSIGVVTLLTLSPFYLKLAHLLIAHILWARLIYIFVNFPDSNKR